MANSCMKEIMGEFIDMKNISTLIPDIKQEMLPDDEEEKKYAIFAIKSANYKAEIMKVCIDDFAMENKVLEMQPEAISYLHFICSMRQRYRCPGRRSRIRSSSAVLYW